MLTEQPIKADPATDRPDVFHQTCGRVGDHAALCGLDVSHLPITDGTGEQRCVVCFGFDDDYCPVTDAPCDCPYEEWTGTSR